jgi:hypothetical protein
VLTLTDDLVLTFRQVDGVVLLVRYRTGLLQLEEDTVSALCDLAAAGNHVMVTGNFAMGKNEVLLILGFTLRNVIHLAEKNITLTVRGD